MEQRRLRLGDILDDYCPRERRVTNHAVVAMIEDAVKQTRCTTCDAEHPYKGGQAPRRKRKDAAPSALFKEVLAGKPAPESLSTASPVPDVVAESTPAYDRAEDDYAALDISHDDSTLDADHIEGADIAEIPDLPEVPHDSDVKDVKDGEDGPVHRPLIRATLPRPEGQKDSRTPPEFTIRQSGGRGGNQPGNAQFRGGNRGRIRSGQGGNGHRPFGGTRFAGGRQGQGQGRGQGGNFRPGQQPRHGGGGRKRSR